MEYTLFLCVFSVLTVCNANCPLYARGLTEEDKRIVVNKHNELRRLISEGRVPGQPRGLNLKEIKYDETLAIPAQQLTDSCQFAHTRVTNNRWPAVGQNLYTQYSTQFDQGASWANAVQDWFNEYPYYSYGGPVTSANGHYTQVIWADTEYIGCGYSHFETNGNFRYQKIYACNYGPAGNYVGQTPYAA